MTFRRFRVDDKAATIALLRASFDVWDGAWAEAYWDWKFERNPQGQARVWLADEAGRIAGCYIWNPVRVRSGGTTALGAQSVDAAVHPDYRGRGLFTDLVRAAIDDDASRELALVFAFPVPAAFRGQVKMGFEPRLTLAAVQRPLLNNPLRRRRFAGLVLNELTSFDSRFDAFGESSVVSDLSVHRDAAYLEWRYRDNPVRDYTVFACERSGEVCGYCVLFVDPPGRRLRRGYVIDLQVLPDSAPAARFLAYHALRRLRSGGARVAISWVRPAGLEAEGLASVGFSPHYASVRRRLKRPDYAPQFIVYENPTGPWGEVFSRDDRVRLRWSLVPGDHDAM